MTMAAYSADLLADACQHGPAFQLPDTMYVHLCTTAPSKSAAGTDSGLGGIVVTMSTDWTRDDDTLENAAAVDFGDAAADATGIHWAELWDTADSSGNRWLYGTLSATYNVVTGQPVSFPIGGLRIPVS